MVGQRIKFNCGEFYPGQEPLLIPGIAPPVPPVIIPEPTTQNIPPFPPYSPSTPEPRRPNYNIPGAPSSQSPSSPSTPTTGNRKIGVVTLTYPGFSAIPGRPKIVPTGPTTPRGGRIPSVSSPYNPNQDPQVSEVIPLEFWSTSSLYHHEYNFFRHELATPLELVTNERYRNIFTSPIAIEVAYFIERQNNSLLPWDERVFQSLTLDKISISLAPRFSNAIDRLHYPGGLLIPRNSFLEMVRRVLLTGQLDVFDPEHYIRLADKQSRDRKITFNRSTPQDYLHRAALGILATGAISSDPNNSQSIQQNQIKRQRRLNEEINARISICTEDNGNQETYLENAGLCFTNSGAIDIGDGYGYYFQIDSRDSGCIPLETTNDNNLAYYVPPDVRYTALSLMQEDPSINLTVTSTSSHEFNQVFSEPLVPLYFALDLNSVADSQTSNQFVNNTSATYTLLTNQSEIDRHAANNGFAITRVNLDYRDFLYQYARQTSSINLNQKDITFRNFDYTLIQNNNIITRNLPFGLIVVPTSSTEDNPFGGVSRITNYSDTIQRSISLIPSINYSDSDQRTSELEESNLFNTSGSYRLGVFENNDTQSITYSYASSNFADITTSAYSTGLAYMVTGVIDELVSRYGVSSLTWWDVFRRLPSNVFGQVMYDMNEEVFNQLSSGDRGTTISHVLKTLNLDNIPLLEDDDLVVIREGDR